jgi:hypothetical protein
LENWQYVKFFNSGLTVPKIPDLDLLGLDPPEPDSDPSDPLVIVNLGLAEINRVAISSTV